MSSYGPALDWDMSDSSHPNTYSTKTDSELSHYSLEHAGRCIKHLPRRRLLSSEEFSDMLEDEDEQEVDDEQFLLERQKSRQERLQVCGRM